MMPRSHDRPCITFDASALGDDLDLYLEAAEAKVVNIRRGLQKQIVWFDNSARKQTPFSIVYLHGFSASSGEIRPVPDRVAQHFSANMFFTRLQGHGTDGDDLGRATIGGWLNDVAEAIHIGGRIGERVILMATSTGAALATWAVAEPALAKKIAATVLLSPNYKLRARGGGLLAAPFARQIIRMTLGRTRSFEPINADHAHFWTYRYSTDALLPLAKAMRLANRAAVENTAVPALFLYSPNDQVVDPKRILSIANRWGVPHAVIAWPRTEDPSAHVLAGKALAPGNSQPVADAITKWLDTTLRPGAIEPG